MEVFFQFARGQNTEKVLEVQEVATGFPERCWPEAWIQKACAKSLKPVNRLPIGLIFFLLLPRTYYSKQ